MVATPHRAPDETRSYPQPASGGNDRVRAAPDMERARRLAGPSHQRRRKLVRLGLHVGLVVHLELAHQDAVAGVAGRILLDGVGAEPAGLEGVADVALDRAR